MSRISRPRSELLQGGPCHMVMIHSGEARAIDLLVKSLSVLPCSGSRSVVHQPTDQMTPLSIVLRGRLGN